MPLTPMDFEIERCTRRCAATGNELAPGETFYSVLVEEDGQLRRHDYSVAAWQGPPAEAIAWWKSQIPDPRARRANWAPSDVMLQFFDELEDQPDRHDMRYVLALLLVRRRVMRLEETERDATGRETLLLYCPRREATYRVPAVMPTEERIKSIQEELSRLLQ